MRDRILRPGPRATDWQELKGYDKQRGNRHAFRREAPPALLHTDKAVEHGGDEGELNDAVGPQSLDGSAAEHKREKNDQPGVIKLRFVDHQLAGSAARSIVTPWRVMTPL